MTTVAPVVPPGAGEAIPFFDLAVALPMRQDIERAVRAVFDHGRFVGGPEVERFEGEFAAYCGTGGAVGVANGTDALELAFAALGIGPGDEVIVPANTFAATAAAVCAVGARPRFADVRSDTLLIDPVAVSAAITSRTAAVVAVHLYGQMVDLDALRPLASRHGLAVVEDAAQAHGAAFAGRRAGSVGDVAAFSFYPGKNLGAAGDGGAVVSGDRAVLDRVRMLANHGRAPYDRHRHVVRGRNSRLDSLQAAVLSAKLPALDAMNERRRAAMRRYREMLPPAVCPVAEDPRATSVHHLAVVQVADRAAAVRRLDAARIGWAVHYPVPCHRQPAFAEHADGPLPVADEAAGRILSLPLWPSMNAAQVDRVCAALAGI